MQVPEFLTAILRDNDVRAWLAAVAIALVVFTLVRGVVWVVRTRLDVRRKKTSTHVDDTVVVALASTRSWLVLIVALWVGSGALRLPPDVRDVVTRLAMIATLLQVGLWASAAIVEWVRLQRAAKIEEHAAAVMTMKFVSIVARLVLWSLVVMLALSNLGVDVTALVAGLGIGGIAVALAAQAVLGDLLASVSIISDKPYVLGDFLIVGDSMGTVEDIGLRTTRIRALSGEQIVFSNSDLLKSRIRNFKRMYERRVPFTIGVTYQTPRAKLEIIPTILREAIERREDVRFDRAHFQKFGDFALVFEAVYYVLSPDYNLFMDIQQAINLEIHRRFEEEDIEMAYPTQTVFLVGEGKGEGAPEPEAGRE